MIPISERCNYCFDGYRPTDEYEARIDRLADTGVMNYSEAFKQIAGKHPDASKKCESCGGTGRK